MPQGWIFMILIILLETVVMSKVMTGKRFNQRICATAFVSNIVSGIAGIITSMNINGGWWLVVWFPWVTSHEVNVKNGYQLLGIITYFLVALIASVLIEWGVNHLMLRKHYKPKSILKGTLMANAVSYSLSILILIVLLLL